MISLLLVPPSMPFERARQGQRVEVGCVGGLGRTGTVLACMATLAGVHPSEAVGWVRHRYHPAAVETDDQAQWVQHFATQHLDGGAGSQGG